MYGIRISKYKKNGVWNSVTLKSVSFLILFTVGILLFVEIETFYILGRYERNTRDNYQESFNLYADIWDMMLENMNNELLLLTRSSNTERDYWIVCKSTDNLAFQTSRVRLSQRLTEIAWNHGNDSQVFVYVPDRDVYFKSANVIAGSGSGLDEDIKKYIEETEHKNEDTWAYLCSDGKNYIIQMYSLYNGYVGCIFNCSTLFKNLYQKENGVIDAAFVESDGTQIIRSLIDEEVDTNKRNKESFFIEVSHLPYMLKIDVDIRKLGTDKSLFLAMAVTTGVIGLMLLLFNLNFNLRYLFRPINKLVAAMIHFSQGKFETRLEPYKKENEIGVLFNTFNTMAGQVTDLQKEIVEHEVAAERMRSNYLRVQIQPHFYTNILNLIYALSQVKDYDTIQRLSMTTGKYFRYLMAEKGSFVKLKEEISCIQNYFEIQKIRYGDCLDFELIVSEESYDQLILPLVLQTFVGNSVKHNVNVVAQLHIIVSVTVKDSYIYMQVEDNGVGIDKEILRKLSCGENISEDGEHIGIMNAKERLQILYNGKGKIDIFSETGKTLITILLPVIL